MSIILGKDVDADSPYSSGPQDKNKQVIVTHSYVYCQAAHSSGKYYGRQGRNQVSIEGDHIGSRMGWLDMSNKHRLSPQKTKFLSHVKPEFNSKYFY